MESLANYGSEDDQESDSGKSTNTKSEDNIGKSSHHTLEYLKQRLHKSEQEKSVDESHSKIDFRKDTTDRSRTKDWYRNYHKEERGSDRDRRKCNRSREQHRRDHNDNRDYRSKQYPSKDERNHRGSSSNFHDRSSRSSSRDRRDRKKYESRFQSREHNSTAKSNAGLSSEKNECKLDKTLSSSSPSSSKDRTSPTDNKPISTALPNYYNPHIINPTKYAEQVQKRKLLWSNKRSEDTINKWGNAKFAQDTDGKVASKFMRLMGIKSVPKAPELETSINNSNSESIRKREEMFSSMEQQYEVARQVTHTMRGVGLGFSSQSRQF